MEFMDLVNKDSKLTLLEKEKEELIKKLDKLKIEYNSKRDYYNKEKELENEVQALKNAIRIKSNQISDKSEKQYTKKFIKWLRADYNVLTLIFGIGAFGMLIQREYFAFVGAIIMALAIPPYLKSQDAKKRLKKNEKPKNETNN